MTRRDINLSDITLNLNVPAGDFSKTYGDADPAWKNDVETSVRDQLVDQIETALEKRRC
jgi:hypothetical protein